MPVVSEWFWGSHPIFIGKKNKNPTHMTVVSEWFWGSHPIFIGKKKFIVAIVLLVVLEVLVVVLNTQQLSQHASYNMQFWPIARSLILNTHFGWSEWVALSATSDFRHMCQILNLVRTLVPTTHFWNFHEYGDAIGHIKKVRIFVKF